MIEVNAMGKVCPIPVIMTKKVLRENIAGENILIRVDNEIATQNLTKMAGQLNIKASVTKLNDAEYTVLYDFQGCEACAILNDTSVLEQDADEYVVVINSDKMGTGDEGFGTKLLENFVYALTEQDRIPKMVVMYNSGVRLKNLAGKGDGSACVRALFGFLRFKRETASRFGYQYVPYYGNYAYQ